MSTERHGVFWKKYPGLVWSNSKASDSVMIMAALTRPRFDEILAICEEFGVERVAKEWKALQEEEVPASRMEMVAAILNNIDARFERAQRANGQLMAGALGQA